MALVPL